MTLSLMFMLTLLVAAFVAGFGWTVGCWLASRILH
jgi:hypothetical protein